MKYLYKFDLEKHILSDARHEHSDKCVCSCQFNKKFRELSFTHFKVVK